MDAPACGRERHAQAGGIVVEVVPGASALNSCAALVGAPLTHDFCAISLSDLLTPWPTIARRLDAVAYSDFVVALYNPKAAAARGRLWKRSAFSCATAAPDTPVAIVKSAYRRRERIEFTTLAHMSDADIGMLSTVLIGNSNTVVQNGLMVTPRGYANKYDVQAGAPRARRAPWPVALHRSTAGWKTCLPTMLRATASKPWPSATACRWNTSATPFETRWKPQRKMPRRGRSMSTDNTNAACGRRYRDP